MLSIRVRLLACPAAQLATWRSRVSKLISWVNIVEEINYIKVNFNEESTCVIVWIRWCSHHLFFGMKNTAFYFVGMLFKLLRIQYIAMSLLSIISNMKVSRYWVDIVKFKLKRIKNLWLNSISTIHSQSFEALSKFNLLLRTQPYIEVCEMLNKVVHSSLHLCARWRTQNNELRSPHHERLKWL